MLQYWRVLLLALALMAVGAVQLYGLFSNEGYQPEQPIKYSHVLHAGVMKMECLYCHFTAEDSKYAAVPSVDVCMGCHQTVRQDSPEIQKLTEYYQSGEPVPWVRIHRLPDHAFFSHQWHVKAGVSCQTCHGPIEEMAVVGQWRKLEMGACMKCHRQDTYLNQINHPPTWNVESIAAEGAHAEDTSEGEWASVLREYNKYYDGVFDEETSDQMLKSLKVYEENVYFHGWTAQARGQNASTDCSTCHQ